MLTIQARYAAQLDIARHPWMAERMAPAFEQVDETAKGQELEIDFDISAFFGKGLL